MTLVDTSVWIDHFRVGVRGVQELLEAEDVLVHPFVLGELACGNLRNRATILADLNELPRVVLAEHGDVLHLVDQHALFGTGIGWIDAHLISSALLSGARLWTSDRALDRAARAIGLSVR